MAVNLVTITITSDPADVAAVRTLAGLVGRVLGVAVDHEYAALLTTELVSNAVRVGAGEVTTTFRAGDGRLRVEVHDHGGGQPEVCRPQPLDENGGRGLLIVDALAHAWGTEFPAVGGTTVWFELLAAGRAPAGTRRARSTSDAALVTTPTGATGPSPGPDGSRPGR